VKYPLRLLFCSVAIVLTVVVSACGSSSTGGTSSAKLDIAFLPKQINNPYFDSAAAGGMKAATELKGTFKQVGPSTASAAAQVPYISTLTQQHVSAIVISGDDPNAVAPALQTATSQGIKVVSYGRGRRTQRTLDLRESGQCTGSWNH
jgi:rhamnose transport system substrate-binding protein